MRLNIVLVKQLTGQRTAPVLTAVNWPYCEFPYKRCGPAKTRLRHPSLPFDSLPYPTRTIRRRVRSVSHVTTKGKEVDHNLWVWGLCPMHASRAWEPRYKNIWISWSLFHRWFFRIYNGIKLLSLQRPFFESLVRLWVFVIYAYEHWFYIVVA